MIISLIILGLVSIALILGTVMYDLLVSITIQGTTYLFYGGVVIMASIILGVLLAAFYNIGKRRAIKNKLKESMKENAVLSGELTNVKANLESMSESLNKKNQELAETKEEMLKILKNSSQDQACGSQVYPDKSDDQDRSDQDKSDDPSNLEDVVQKEEQ